MKKWLIPFIATAMVVIGCGGSGGGSSSTGGSGTTSVTGDSVATANLASTPGQISFTYLSGQGRAAGNVGDLIATITTPTVIDSSGVKVAPGLGSAVNIDLTGGTLGGTQNVQNLNVSDTSSGNSHQFSTYELIVDKASVIDADGVTLDQEAPASGSTSRAIDQQFTAQIGVFPGRQTAVQLYLNDGMVTVDQTAATATLDRTLFLSTNTANNANGSPYVSGFFSDFVQFDLTHVASLPQMADGTTVPAYAYFNGDRIGLSGQAAGSLFQIFTPSTALTGTWAAPTSLTNFGTYSLKEVSPTDITQTLTITSFTGTWKPYTSCFNNVGTFEVFLFPHNDDSYQQDVVVFSRNSAGNIIQFYFGLADLTAGTFWAAPISSVTNAVVDSTTLVNGTFTSLLDGSGNKVTTPASVRQGRFTLTAPTATGTLPTGFKSSGRFVVYRR